MYMAYQGVHGPRQAPEHYWGRYNSTIENMNRRIFAGMVTAVDEGASLGRRLSGSAAWKTGPHPRVAHRQ